MPESPVCPSRQKQSSCFEAQVTPCQALPEASPPPPELPFMRTLPAALGTQAPPEAVAQEGSCTLGLQPPGPPSVPGGQAPVPSSWTVLLPNPCLYLDLSSHVTFLPSLPWPPCRRKPPSHSACLLPALSSARAASPVVDISALPCSLPPPENGMLTSSQTFSVSILLQLLCPVGCQVLSGAGKPLMGGWLADK